MPDSQTSEALTAWAPSSTDVYRWRDEVPHLVVGTRHLHRHTGGVFRRVRGITPDIVLAIWERI
jgi:hypothetical protein